MHLLQHVIGGEHHVRLQQLLHSSRGLCGGVKGGCVRGPVQQVLPGSSSSSLGARGPVCMACMAAAGGSMRGHEGAFGRE
jgi:hypothetical protein